MIYYCDCSIGSTKTPISVLTAAAEPWTWCACCRWNCKQTGESEWDHGTRCHCNFAHYQLWLLQLDELSSTTCKPGHGICEKPTLPMAQKSKTRHRCCHSFALSLSHMCALCEANCFCACCCEDVATPALVSPIKRHFSTLQSFTLADLGHTAGGGCGVYHFTERCRHGGHSPWEWPCNPLHLLTLNILLEVAAVSTSSQRGVGMVATAHGNDLHSLLKNPELVSLCGGVQVIARLCALCRCNQAQSCLFRGLTYP
jgi:hypothetical protein